MAGKAHNCLPTQECTVHDVIWILIPPSDTHTNIQRFYPLGLSLTAVCPQVLVVFVESLIAQVPWKWPLRVWLANELPGRGSVVSRSNTGLCSLIKVTYLQGEMPQRDVMTKERGLAGISLATKWTKWGSHTGWNCLGWGGRTFRKRSPLNAQLKDRKTVLWY